MQIDEKSWAGYIHDMTLQLADIARGSGLERLASLLEVAAIEAKAETGNGENARPQ